MHATFVALCRVALAPPHGRVRRATAALCSARSACVVVVVCRTLCAQLAVLGLPPVVAALWACVLHRHVCLGIAPWWLPPNRSAAAVTLAGGAHCRDRRVCLPSLARRRGLAGFSLPCLVGRVRFPGVACSLMWAAIARLTSGPWCRLPPRPSGGAVPLGCLTRWPRPTMSVGGRLHFGVSSEACKPVPVPVEWQPPLKRRRRL